MFPGICNPLVVMNESRDKLIQALVDADVEFVIVGGTAALIHGAVTPTQDLDVVISMELANLQRVLVAIAPFHPKYATRPDLGVISLTPQELSRFRLILLDTDVGRLDILGDVAPIGGFEKISYDEVELVPGVFARVIALDQLIEIKAHLNRPKDKLVEAELRAIRDKLAQANTNK